VADLEKRQPAGGVRLRKFIDVIVEDRLSYTLFRCAIADISESGMRIVCDQYLAKGTKYTFTMKKPPALVLRGEVRWVRRSEPDTFHCGILFIDVGAEDQRRLTSFLDIERQRVPTNS
jgi:hypothetical protein